MKRRVGALESFDKLRMGLTKARFSEEMTGRVMPVTALRYVTLPCSMQAGGVLKSNYQIVKFPNCQLRSADEADFSLARRSSADSAGRRWLVFTGSLGSFRFRIGISDGFRGVVKRHNGALQKLY